MEAAPGDALRASWKRACCWASFVLLFVIGLVVVYTGHLQEGPLAESGELHYQERPIERENPVKSASEDEVFRLPGAKFKPKFRHYSGYLEADKASNRFWHYWFLESQSRPSKDPLVLWLNGGPGCSSLMGLLTELGPFRIDQLDGRLQENPHAWNKRANVIFIECPAGVGFSYASDGSLDSDDDTTAEQNRKALKSFFDKFPHFKNRSLYLTGESYASVYLSTLAVLLDHDREINLRGVAVGNGCLEGLQGQASLLFFAYYRGIIDEETWSKFSKLCCNGRVPNRGDCRRQTKEASEDTEEEADECQDFLEDTALFILTGGLNIYNLYANCSHSGRKETYWPRCYNNTLITNYLNRADVWRALHVPGNLSGKFVSCNDNIKYTRMYIEGLTGLFQRLLNSSRKLRLLVYSGDHDLLCNHLGDDWFVQNLNQTLVGKRRAWYLDNQVAGYSKRYQGITFVTVKGAGHMVPVDRPVESLHLFHEFISPSSFLFDRSK